MYCYMRVFLDVLLYMRAFLEVLLYMRGLVIKLPIVFEAVTLNYRTYTFSQSPARV